MTRRADSTLQTIVTTVCFSEHEITYGLRQQRGIHVEVNEAMQHCDFSCGSSSVLYYDIQNAERQQDQASLVLRVKKARHRCGNQPIILMTRMSTASDASLATLSWLNIECGVAEQSGLVLVWSVDEAVQFLTSLAASAVTSLEFNRVSRPSVGDAPLPVLIDALTQTPQIVTRNDVVRIANRKSCIADILMSEASEWKEIAGLGQKKATRLQHLFRVSFLSSTQKVRDHVGTSGDMVTIPGKPLLPPQSLSSFAIDAPVAVPARATPGQQLMMEALQRHRDDEDAEDTE